MYGSASAGPQATSSRVMEPLRTSTQPSAPESLGTRLDETRKLLGGIHSRIDDLAGRLGPVLRSTPDAPGQSLATPATCAAESSLMDILGGLDSLRQKVEDLHSRLWV